MKYLLAFLIFSMLSLGPTGLGNEKNEADADATGVCNHSPDIPLETTGDARQFCSRFRGFCESTKVAFLADGFACHWKCSSWWGASLTFAE